VTGVPPSDMQAWLVYSDLVERTATFVSSLHAAPVDVDMAEAGLAALLGTIESSLAPFQAEGEQCSVAITEGMERAALVTKESALRKAISKEAGNRTAGTNTQQLVHASVYRRYVSTLLGACCQEQRVGRSGEPDLPAYLSIRERLLVWMLEHGADVNRVSMEKGMYGSGMAAPRLPIDSLISPALLTALLDTCERLQRPVDLSRSSLLTCLAGGGWTGCHLGALPGAGQGGDGDEGADPFRHRYGLLTRLLAISTTTPTRGFTRAAVEEALHVARLQQQLYNGNVQHTINHAQTDASSLQIWECGLKCAEFVMREIEHILQ
jgi:hypothetical protein